MNKKVITVYIAGDSTASYYDENRAPRTGWGQVINIFFTKDVIVKNEAASGRSSKSFISEGRLDKIEKEIRTGDYLFIQFGHNDEKPDQERHTEPYGTYKTSLEEYIRLALDKNAQPVLMTPISRRKFDSSGEIVPTHGSYPDAMKELAYELDVPLIDMCEKSRNLFENFGEEQTKKIFLWFKEGENVNYPEGVQDNTHFSAFGATEMSRLIIQGIKELGLPLAEFIRQENTTF